ncbi:MAG: TetR/AcrR family transcriptional regulator [Spirochaetales bacterium]|nr:TetR/AcrR family transcriptional regulator [Spirochaetales bacterium]
MESKEEPKRMKAEYRSSIRSKTMIKEALLELMVEKPFDKITITDIVKKADINRGTFYAHYDNTSEVLRSISASVIDEIASVFKAKNNSDALWNPRGYLKQISDFFLTNPNYFARLVATDKISEVLNDARHSAIEKILNDLGTDLPDSARAQLAILLDYSMSGITALYTDILLEKIPVTLEDSAEYIANLLAPQRNVVVEVLQQMQK